MIRARTFRAKPIAQNIAYRRVGADGATLYSAATPEPALYPSGIQKRSSGVHPGRCSLSGFALTLAFFRNFEGTRRFRGTAAAADLASSASDFEVVANFGGVPADRSDPTTGRSKLHIIVFGHTAKRALTQKARHSQLTSLEPFVPTASGGRQDSTQPSSTILTRPRPLEPSRHRRRQQPLEPTTRYPSPAARPPTSSIASATGAGWQTRSTRR